MASIPCLVQALFSVFYKRFPHCIIVMVATVHFFRFSEFLPHYSLAFSASVCHYVIFRFSMLCPRVEAFPVRISLFSPRVSVGTHLILLSIIPDTPSLCALQGQFCGVPLEVRRSPPRFSPSSVPPTRCTTLLALSAIQGLGFDAVGGFSPVNLSQNKRFHGRGLKRQPFPPPLFPHHLPGTPPACFVCDLGFGVWMLWAGLPDSLSGTGGAEEVEELCRPFRLL